jgi:hypothetical protein
MVMPDKMPNKKSMNKAGEYSLIPKFLGYTSRGDPTKEPVGTLVSPSQNVVIKTTGRVAAVAGYVLDGVGSSVIDSGILSNYDFTNFKGDVRNLRAGFLTTAGNDGKLQYRYGPTSTWINLQTGLTNVRMCYTSFSDTTNLVKLVLWVNGLNQINAWNGAVTTFASATNSTGFISVLNPAPTAGGTGYVVGDILTITGGTATAIVSTVSSGVITAVSLVTTGSGYTSGTGKATTGGTGTGATLNITTVVNNSIVNQSSLTWAQQGFTQSGGSVVISGTNYTYTAMVGNTLVGIGTDPTIPGYAAGVVIHQAVVVTQLSSMTAILATLGPTVIGCGRNNQVYIGASNSINLYISKVNTYTDYSFTTPVRVAGEGFLIPLDAPPVKFIPQEVNGSGDLAYDMYVAEGTDSWGVVRSTLSSDLSKETLQFIRLKVAPLQGARSERLVTKMKNNIMYVGNDNVANFFGIFSYQYVPAIVDFSYPIIDDMNSYDFTDASIFYHKNYAYVAIPKAGVVRIYNMTDQTGQYTSFTRDMEDVTKQPWFWEAPVTYPIAGFYVVNGQLYGHSYTTSESYQLFTGQSLNSQDIDTNATFCFDDKGDRTQSKGSDEIYIEGYIQQNTVLNVGVSGDLDSFMSTQNVSVDGSDNSIVAYGSGAHSLGKNPLGSQPLGGAQTSTSTRPAWFHVFKTYNETPFYLEQISFATKGVDLGWELITFGTNAEFTTEGNDDITQ